MEYAGRRRAQLTSARSASMAESARCLAASSAVVASTSGADFNWFAAAFKVFVAVTCNVQPLHYSASAANAPGQASLPCMHIHIAREYASFYLRMYVTQNSVNNLSLVGCSD